MNLTRWIPAHLSWQGSEAFVDWCWLGDQRFTEPFFDDTIGNALNKPFNRLFMHRTSIAKLEAWHNNSPGLEPSGFVFHMSRCGSTLISQMLATLPRTIVISEAQPVDWLARTNRVSTNIKSEWLRWMVSALGQPREGNETHCFIKFDSVTVISLAFIRSVFPSVPWIFVFRNPEDVLLSQMRETAAAMTPGIVTDINVLDAPFAETLSMTPEDYAARAIGRLCECALADNSGMLVNYSQLPEAVDADIAAHFNLNLSPSDKTQMQDITARDSKRPAQTFQKQTQIDVPQRIQTAAAQWIEPHYTRLEQSRLIQHSFSQRCSKLGVPERG